MVKRFKVRGFYISFNGYKVGRWKVLRDQKTPILNLMFLYLNFSYFWCPLTIRLAQRPEVPKAARRAGAPPHLLTLRGEWTRRSNEWRMERVTPDETSEAGTTWGFLTFLLLAVSCRSPSSGSSCLHSSSHLPSGRHEGTEWSEPEARVVNDMRWVSDKRMGRLEVVHSRLCPFAFHSPTFPAAINNNMNPRFSALILSSSLHVGLCLSVRSPCPPSHLSTRHSVSRPWGGNEGGT